jgi:hypothetical protein
MIGQGSALADDDNHVRITTLGEAELLIDQMAVGGQDVSVDMNLRKGIS